MKVPKVGLETIIARFNKNRTEGLAEGVNDYQEFLEKEKEKEQERK
jgi:hypothetical protein